MARFEPAYLNLLRNGKFSELLDAANARLAACDLCPRVCGVDRTQGERGECKTGRLAVVCSAHPHFGEEAPLVGKNGSGTIFFTWCNLHCRFCQNCRISQLGDGSEVEAGGLAAMMLQLQAMGCHNVNLVSPSHVVPQIIAAVAVAAEGGLRLPLVYNSGGYDSVETLRLLGGIVDIYMPDMKYADEEIAKKFSAVADYPRVNRAAVIEMHRQVGDLVLDERGIALRGLLVRHLVLPGGLAGTERIVRFLAEEVSPHTCINIMDQYHPSWLAHDMPPLDRSISSAEYDEAVRLAHAAGFHRPRLLA